MRASASALSLVSFAAALLTATAYTPRADACGALPPLYVTVNRVLPAAGTVDVALDGALVVHATGWFDSSQIALSSELPALLDVQLTARGTGTRVAGTVASWSEGRAVFQPTSALSPDTTYDAVAVITNTAPKPDGNAGVTTSSTSFTTGTTKNAPLGFGGEPSITFEDLDHEVCDAATQPPCGGECGQMIPRRDRFAVIALPAPVGGDAVGGFEYATTVSLVGSDLPDTTGVGAARSVANREPSRLPVPLFPMPTKYGICVETTVRDVHRQPVSSGRRCYTKEEVWAVDTKASAGGAGGSGGGAAGAAGGAVVSSVQESGPPAQDPGCSLAAPAEEIAGGRGFAAALLLGLGLGFAVRRHRGRGPTRDG